MITRWIVATFIVGMTGYLLPGVSVDGIWAALVTAIVIAFLNMFVRPLVIALTLPATFLTLGLFLLVINTWMVLLASSIVPGFHIAGFWWALLFSIIVSLANAMLLPKVLRRSSREGIRTGTRV